MRLGESMERPGHEGHRDMADQVRAAIVGTGFSGRLQARSIRLAGAHLVAVAASDPERSRRAAQELGADRGADAMDLVTADDVDVVHIAAPNALHEPLSLAALAAGKHVVCEKPLATTLEGARRLADAAAAGDVVATVPFVYRFHPMVREMRARVQRGDLGAIRLLHGTYLQDWLLGAADWNWRVDSEQGGASRTFADIGSHWCDLVEFVTGHRITAVSARTATVLPERLRDDHRETFTAGDGGTAVPVTTEDLATVQLETDRGALGSLVVSQVSAGRKNRLWLELDGEDAALAFDQEDPERLWEGRRDGARVSLRDPDALDPAAARYATTPAGHPQGYADCFDAFVADTYEAIRNGAPDGLPRFADGLRAAAITDAVMASAASRTWTDVPTA
jgi:predicted dehydrogenase